MVVPASAALAPAWSGAPLVQGRTGGGVSAPARAGRALAWLLVAALLASVVAPTRASWDRERLDRAAGALGPRAVAALADLHVLLQTAGEMAEADQLRAVNDYFNRRIAFREDRVVWQRDDHWTTPLEVLARGEGDCEDYALAKYFTLVALGMPTARLRLVYVRAVLPEGPGRPSTVQAHMVLAAYPAAGGDDPMILDNLRRDIRPASRRGDLTPVFSFNGEGLWQGTGDESAGDPTVRLSPWRDVAARGREEGWQP